MTQYAHVRVVLSAASLMSMALNALKILITSSTRSSCLFIWPFSPSVQCVGYVWWRPIHVSRGVIVSGRSCAKEYRWPSGRRFVDRVRAVPSCAWSITVLLLIQVWTSVGGVQKLKDEYGSDLYRQLQNKPIEEDIRNIITVDVPRTFPDNIFFQPASENQSALLRILCAFAAHNPYIGYCQVCYYMLFVLFQNRKYSWIFCFFKIN